MKGNPLIPFALVVLGLGSSDNAALSGKAYSTAMQNASVFSRRSTVRTKAIIVTRGNPL
jgi:hypothetical protein